MPSASKAHLSPAASELKRFYLYFFNRYCQDAAEWAPGRMEDHVDEIFNKNGKRLAESGIRQAVGDCLEMSHRFTAEEVSRLDFDLRQQGIITLSALRKLFSKDLRKMISRGRLATDEEFYLAKNFLASLRTAECAEFAMLCDMVDEYEERGKH